MVPAGLGMLCIELVIELMEAGRGKTSRIMKGEDGRQRTPPRRVSSSSLGIWVCFQRHIRVTVWR